MALIFCNYYLDLGWVYKNGRGGNNTKTNYWEWGGESIGSTSLRPSPILCLYPGTIAVSFKIVCGDGMRISIKSYFQHKTSK